MSQIIDLTTGYNDLVDQMNQMDAAICKALTERLLRFLHTVKDDPALANADVQAAIRSLAEGRPPWVRDWRILNNGALLATIRYDSRDEFQLELGPQLLRDDADVAFAELAADVAVRVADAKAKKAERAKYHEQRRLAFERAQLDALLLKYNLVAVPKAETP